MGGAFGVRRIPPLSWGERRPTYLIAPFRTPYSDCEIQLAIWSGSCFINPSLVRIWWNWQTRYFEVVVGQPVQVQVLLCAPNSQ